MKSRQALKILAGRVRARLEKGLNIEAIKLVSAEMGYTLKEAKDFVDHVSGCQKYGTAWKEYVIASWCRSCRYIAASCECSTDRKDCADDRGTAEADQTPVAPEVINPCHQLAVLIEQDPGSWYRFMQTFAEEMNAAGPRTDD